MSVGKGAEIYVKDIHGVQVALGLMTADAVFEWKFADLFGAAEQKESRRVPIEELQILDQDVWFSGTGRVPTLRNIAKEIQRVEECQLDRPAILIESCGLVDGTHRALKAHLLGAADLLCVYFTLEELFALPHLTKEHQQRPAD